MREGRIQHHAHGDTQKEICWVNGGRLSPKKCDKCQQTVDDKVTSLLIRLDRSSGNRR